MAAKSTARLKPPVIPSLPARVDPDVRRAFQSLREWSAAVDGAGGFPSGEWAAAVDGQSDILTPYLDQSTPPQLTNFAAAGALRTITLTWDRPRWTGQGTVEIWRSDVDNLGTAVPVDTANPAAGICSDTPPRASLAVTYYYWARIVGQGGVSGPFNAVAGTPCSTGNDPAYLLEVLSRQISESQLTSDLSGRIAAIDLPTVGIGDRLDSLALSILEFIPDQYDRFLALTREKAVTDATVDIDPATGAISLRATAIITTDVEARVTTAEQRIDALNGTIVANVNDISALESGVTAQQSTIEQLQSDISLRATSTYVDAQLTNLMQQTDPAVIDQLGNDLPAALLWNVLMNNDLANRARQGEANYALADLAIQANSDAISAEASERLLLAARVENNAAAIALETTARTDAESALSKQLSTLAATVDANTAAIQLEITARADADSAVSQQLLTLQSTVAGNTTSLQIQATAIDGILGEYSVKIDNNGYVSGYGLISEPNNGTPVSRFIVLADQFAVGSPGTPDLFPFIVDATYGTIIDVAAIRDLTATNIRAGGVTADCITTPNLAALSANLGTVTAGLIIGPTAMSPNYVPGVSGWGILPDGTAEFRNIIARGDIEASSLGAYKAVGTANIQDLAVDTLHIKDGAISIHASAITATTTVAYNAAAQVLQQLAMESLGGGVFLSFACDYGGPYGPYQLQYSLYRDEKIIWGGGFAGGINLTWLDFPGEGIHIYKWFVSQQSYAGGLITLNNSRIIIIELKK